MIVGEHRTPNSCRCVQVTPGSTQVARRSGGFVEDVLSVSSAVAVTVCGPPRPRRRHELHRALRPRSGEIGGRAEDRWNDLTGHGDRRSGMPAMVRLDLADTRQEEPLQAARYRRCRAPVGIKRDGRDRTFLDRRKYQRLLLALTRRNRGRTIGEPGHGAGRRRQRHRRHRCCPHRRTACGSARRSRFGAGRRYARAGRRSRPSALGRRSRRTGRREERAIRRCRDGGIADGQEHYRDRARHDEG